MRKIVIALVALLTLTACQIPEGSVKLTIETDNDNYQVIAELATTYEEKRVGLMNRTELEEGKGMLFVYDSPLVASFWMKNTLIPLDMIFIDSDHVIQTIEHSAQPCPPGTQCPTYSSNVPVQYILEVPGGYTKKHQIEVGDEVKWNAN